MADLPRIYWDSGCFLAILNGEAEAADCRRILNDARDGKLEMVTSFWTVTEVIRPRGTSGPVPESSLQVMRDFFENDYLHLRPVDRLVAERARELCWAHQPLIYACDATHLATALLYECSIFETKDGTLKSLDGQVGNPPLKIRGPTWIGQLDALEDSEQ